MIEKSKPLQKFILKCIEESRFDDILKEIVYM